MPLYITDTATTTATVATTATQLSSGNLLANTAKLIAPSNTAREQLTIYNKENVTVFFGYNNSVSATNFAFKLALDGYYEMPTPIYTGDLWAFCTTNNTLAVVEFT